MTSNPSHFSRLALVAAMALGATACGSDNNTPTPTADAAADTAPATDVAADTSQTADVVGDAATDAPSTLYVRLGRRAGIATAIDAIVARELMDPEIASYFYFQVTRGSNGMPPVNGHPSVAQLKSCLVNQLSAAAGGPETYPGTPADNMGWQCRDMATSHAGLRIPGSVFDRFVMIAAGVLMSAGVADADIGTIGMVLNSTRATIIDPSRDGGSFITPDASVDGGG